MWYYSKSGTSEGPFDESAIAEALAAETIAEDTLMWSDGMPGWAPLSQTELSRLLPENIEPLPPAIPTPFAPAAPVVERRPWFRQTWLHVLLFVFLPYIQVSLMWIYKIFSFRTRIILSVVGLILTISYLSDDSEGFFSNSDKRAKESAKSLVMENLKAPSTAKFPELRILHKEHPWYQVFVFVDAENSYGAYVRSSYVCVIKLEDDEKFSHRPGASLQKLDESKIETAGFDLLKVIREGNNWPGSQ